MRTKEEHLSQAKRLRRLAQDLPIDDRQRALKLAALNEALARVQKSKPISTGEGPVSTEHTAPEEQHVLSSHQHPGLLAALFRGANRLESTET